MEAYSSFLSLASTNYRMFMTKSVMLEVAITAYLGISLEEQGCIIDSKIEI